MQYPNKVEFCVYGERALFADPCFGVGGEKCSYLVPTYEALKGVLASVYWKPTIIWYIDKVRIMNQIRMEAEGTLIPRYHEGGKDLSYYTYLKDVKYQVQAHFEFNMNRDSMAKDRNEHKHFLIANRMIDRGGRRDVFLGRRNCQAYVEPCAFGEGEGYYDSRPDQDFGFMYHGRTYPDEAYSEETRGVMTVNMWTPVMHQGVIEFLRPEDCPVHKIVRKMNAKDFPDKGETEELLERSEIA